MTEMERFLLSRQQHYDSDREFLRIDGVARSYSEVLADARALARGLAGRGVVGGTRVASLMDTSHAAVDAWFACGLLGAVDIPFNTNYRGRLLRHLIDDSQADVIVCDGELLPHLEDALDDEMSSRPTIITDADPAASRGSSISLADLYDRSDGEPVTGAGGEVVLYTSGTTGPSKGVVHNQRGCILLAEYVAEVCAYTSDDRLLNFFPLYHQNARYTGVLSAIAAGASIDLERRFTSSGFWTLCRERGITAFNYLGSVLGMILSATPTDGPGEEHAVRLGWGAGAAEDERAVFTDRFGVELIEVYGLSEAPMATVCMPDGECAPGSAGREGKFFTVRVVDEAGDDAPLGTPGEIVLRPKMRDVFTRGYYRNDRATVAATTDLWFHSGDRGYLTEDGDLFFVDRSKDALRRRGENISTWEVETVLGADPRVREVAVYGVTPADGDEEEVMAAVVLEDAESDLASIVADAAAELPPYAVPRFVRAIGDLPRTPTLKVQKNVLREDGLTSDTHDLTKEN